MVVQPLHSSFVLRPTRQHPQELQLVYTRRELPVRRLYSSSSSSHEDEEVAVEPTLSSAPIVAAPIVAAPIVPAAAAAAATAMTTKSSSPIDEDSSFRPVKRSRTTVLPWNKAIHTIPNLQSEFEPPTDPHYWKQRCFHWQSICQTTRQKLREMEEDQRQLRKRLWQLEEQVVWTASRNKSAQQRVSNNNSSNTNNRQVPISPTSEDRRPPTWIVTVPPRKCCFYLTDCEGLSDSEYVDEELEDYEEGNDQDEEIEPEEQKSQDEDRDPIHDDRQMIDRTEQVQTPASEQSDSKRSDDAVVATTCHKNSYSCSYNYSRHTKVDLSNTGK